MKKVMQFTVLLSLMILALTACIRAEGATDVATTPPATTPQSMKTRIAIREAQVQSVEIQFMQTNPVQVNAVARGNLTEACATFAEPQLSFTTNTFMIKLLTVSPSDRGCLQVTTPFEQTIPLNTTDLPAGDYTVKVNGVSAVFTLPAGDNQTAVPALLASQARQRLSEVALIITRSAILPIGRSRSLLKTSVQENWPNMSLLHPVQKASCQTLRSIP